MFWKPGRKTIVLISVTLILALFIGACGSATPIVAPPTASQTEPPPTAAPSPAVLEEATPPAGGCDNDGITQVSTTWVRTCISSKWVPTVTATSTGTVVIVPIEIPTPSPVVLPAGMSSSFSDVGITLPETATSYVDNGAGMTMFFFGTATMSLTKIDYIYIVANETTVTALAAKGIIATTIASLAVPVTVLGAASLAAYGLAEVMLMARPTTIITPPMAIAAPTAPIVFNSYADLSTQKVLQSTVSLMALEQALNLGVTQATVTPITLDADIFAAITTSSKTITLPRGTVIVIETTIASGICQTKGKIDVQFPWGKETFFGFSFNCLQGWNWFEMLDSLAKNFAQRSLDLFQKGVLTEAVVKVIVQDTVMDIVSFMLAILKELMARGL
jgi:hypothetical protein